MRGGVELGKRAGNGPKMMSKLLENGPKMMSKSLGNGPKMMSKSLYVVVVERALLLRVARGGRKLGVKVDGPEVKPEQP